MLGLRLPVQPGRPAAVECLGAGASAGAPLCVLGGVDARALALQQRGLPNVTVEQSRTAVHNDVPLTYWAERILGWSAAAPPDTEGGGEGEYYGRRFSPRRATRYGRPRYNRSRRATRYSYATPPDTSPPDTEGEGEGEYYRRWFSPW